MVTKIYALVWLLAVGAIGLFYLTGNLSDLTLTVFGFLLSTLAFAGLVVVLPWWVDRRFAWAY